MWIARRLGADLVTVEDGFLRSVATGRDGGPGRSVVIDRQGIYFETNAPNDLADLITQSDSLTDDDIHRAQSARALLIAQNLSKYNDFPDTLPDLPDRYVLVIDQTQADASIAGAGAQAQTFAQMLATARTDHPDATILIKTHPETLAGHRQGHFGPNDADPRTIVLTTKTSPWPLLQHAQAIYAVSSLMGFEAVLAGQRPVMFGDAFYCGWGLTEDRHPRTRQKGIRTPDQLFHAAYLQYCHWFSANGTKTRFELVAYSLAAQAYHARDHRDWILYGMRLWKRGFLRRYLGQSGARVSFAKSPKDAPAARHAVWAGQADTLSLRQPTRIEDGFLRSSGLGANLVPPLSLAFDDVGIYYDPAQPSRLEQLIAKYAELSPAQSERAGQLRDSVLAANLSKYNLGGEFPKFQAEGREIILVPGQVEDDASILKGARGINSNLALLEATRAAFPQAFVIYKTHPDVSAGLRKGAIRSSELSQFADAQADDADIASLLEQVDRVATMTSLTGFEALLRDVAVTTFGLPFYAGWGLTDDRAEMLDRRNKKVSLNGLIHAALIDYPRYWDPKLGTPISAEEAVDLLKGPVLRPNAGLRVLAKVQGLLASQAFLWR